MECLASVCVSVVPCGSKEGLNEAVFVGAFCILSCVVLQ